MTKNTFEIAAFIASWSENAVDVIVTVLVENPVPTSYRDKARWIAQKQGTPAEEVNSFTWNTIEIEYRSAACASVGRMRAGNAPDSEPQPWPKKRHDAPQPVRERRGTRGAR
jgi:hypothetical protein